MWLWILAFPQTIPNASTFKSKTKISRPRKWPFRYWRCTWDHFSHFLDQLACTSECLHWYHLRDELSQPNGLNGQQTEAQRVVSTWEQPSMFDNSCLSLCLLSVLFVLCSFFLHKQYIHLDQNSKDTKTHSVKSLPPNHAHQVANYPPWKQPVDPGYYLHMQQIWIHVNIHRKEQILCILFWNLFHLKKIAWNLLPQYINTFFLWLSSISLWRCT